MTPSEPCDVYHAFTKTVTHDMKNPYKIEYRCTALPLVLKPFTLNMAEVFAQQANDPKVQAMDINFALPFTAEHAQAAIKRYIHDWNQKTCYYFAIFHAEQGTFIGSISLRMYPEHQLADLGYWIGAEFWNRGYTSLAAYEMMRFAFVEFNIEKLNAQHMGHNMASGRVMQKIGMTQEGILRNHWLKEDKRYDLVLYGLLRSDFLAAQQKQVVHPLKAQAMK